MDTVAVNPFRCRMWDLHDRLEHGITEESCRSEIESFARHGQFIPVLGRPLHADPEHDIELIYGARRLFVARHLNKPLIVELRDVSDREAIVAMDIENRHRHDISPYERGLSYARWLREGYFKSQHDLSRGLKISAPGVSRLLKLARLPDWLVQAFETPHDLCEEWGLKLAELLNDAEAESRARLIVERLDSEARRSAPREIYRQLVRALTRPANTRPDPSERVISGADGTPLFRIQHKRGTVAVVLPSERLSEATFAAVKSGIASILTPISDE